MWKTEPVADSNRRGRRVAVCMKRDALTFDNGSFLPDRRPQGQMSADADEEVRYMD
jgi:hypothetical protein